MNEDDTFKKLKQIPFEEMQMILIRATGSTRVTGYDGVQKVPSVSFEANGWTVKDYITEWEKRNTTARDLGGFTFAG